jgi:flagellar biosynthesis protein FlhG
MQQPFSLSFPKSQATRLNRDISQKIMDESKDEKGNVENTGVKSFITRLVKLWNG